MLILAVNEIQTTCHLSLMVILCLILIGLFIFLHLPSPVKGGSFNGAFMLEEGPHLLSLLFSPSTQTIP